MHDLVFASRQELVEELARMKRAHIGVTFAWFLIGATLGAMGMLIYLSWK
jgi:hypothetical protein